MYVLIEYDGGYNNYSVYGKLAEAKKDFIEKARKIGKRINDPEILANDQDDMEELADGLIYAPNGKMCLEIVGN